MLTFGFVSIKTTPKIIWKYHYVHGCKKVTEKDEIDTTPDKRGRWQIRGFIQVKKGCLYPYLYHYDYTLLVQVVTIKQRVNSASNKEFYCVTPSIIGMDLESAVTFTEFSPNTLMSKVEFKFDELNRFLMVSNPRNSTI